MFVWKVYICPNITYISQFFYSISSRGKIVVLLRLLSLSSSSFSSSCSSSSYSSTSSSPSPPHFPSPPLVHPPPLILLLILILRRLLLLLLLFLHEVCFCRKNNHFKFWRSSGLRPGYRIRSTIELGLVKYYFNLTEYFLWRHSIKAVVYFNE